MRRKQKVYLVLACVLAVFLLMVLAGMMFIGNYERTKSRLIDLSAGAELAPPAQSDGLTTKESFLRYSYLEEHSDGSYVNYIVYPFDGHYCGYMKYGDPSGGIYIASSVLKEDASARFEMAYQSFSLAKTTENTTNKRTAKLYFSGKSGESSYSVDPLDISGFGFIDPWSDTKPQTIIGLSDDIAGKYDTDEISKLADCHSDKELAAYISCLNKAFCENGKVVKRMSVTGKFTGGYQAVVDYMDGSSTEYRISTYGHVENL